MATRIHSLFASRPQAQLATIDSDIAVVASALAVMAGTILIVFTIIPWVLA